MNPNKILHFYAVNPNKILHFYAVNPNQILDLYAVSPIRIIYLYRGKPLFAHFSYRRSMLTKLPSALSSRLTAYKIYPWSWADDEREQNKKSVTRKDICINVWLARVKVYLVYCILFQFNPWRIYIYQTISLIFTRASQTCIQISFQSKKKTENQFEDH